MYTPKLIVELAGHRKPCNINLDRQTLGSQPCMARINEMPACYTVVAVLLQFSYKMIYTRFAGIDKLLYDVGSLTAIQ